MRSCSTNLLNQHINFISIFHIQLFRGLGVVQTFSVKQESHIIVGQLSYSDNFTDCFWQYASMSFLSWVVDLILKKTY